MNKYIDKKYKLLLPLLLVMMLFYVIDTDVAYTNSSLVEGISEDLIRFHVIANSDTDEDQSLKLDVKDRVVGEMKLMLEDVTTKDESKAIIFQNMDSLKGIALEVIEEEGYEYDVEISLENETFPLKKYGDIVLPPGEYEALVIRIGEAKGKNWWCVLFPPLCFVDATHNVVDEESKDALKTVLSDEEYNTVFTGSDEDVSIKVRFKLLDWLNDKEKEFNNNTTIVYDTH